MGEVIIITVAMIALAILATFAVHPSISFNRRLVNRAMSIASRIARLTLTRKRCAILFFALMVLSPVHAFSHSARKRDLLLIQMDFEQIGASAG